MINKLCKKEMRYIRQNIGIEQDNKNTLDNAKIIYLIRMKKYTLLNLRNTL